LQKGIQSQLPELFRKAKHAMLTISLDTNDDPEDRWGSDIQNLFPYLDILFVNEREACKLAQTESFGTGHRHPRTNGFTAGCEMRRGWRTGQSRRSTIYFPAVGRRSRGFDRRRRFL